MTRHFLKWNDWSRCQANIWRQDCVRLVGPLLVVHVVYGQGDSKLLLLLLLLFWVSNVFLSADMISHFRLYCANFFSTGSTLNSS